MRRDMNESEAMARARAEVDPATRWRITAAHDAIADAYRADPSAVRALHRGGRLALSDAAAAGLTRGEALAAGIGKHRRA